MNAVKHMLATDRSRILMLLLATLFCTGCERGPAAPELRNSPVYSNRLEGFRFLVPDGWNQSASSNLPQGDLETEAFLVRYSLPTSESGAQVQVLCFQDKSGDANLVEHHTLPAFGITNWTLEGEPRIEAVGNREGSWLYYKGINGNKTLGKEVLCFRKGDRVYSFVGTFGETDEKARQAIQRAFASVIWE